MSLQFSCDTVTPAGDVEYCRKTDMERERFAARSFILPVFYLFLCKLIPQYVINTIKHMK